MIIQSKHDDHFWMVTSGGEVKKMTFDDVIKEVEGCYNSLKVSFCPEKGKMLIWSRNGRAAIGVINADLFDPHLWCNLERFAALVNSRLPEPILPSDIEAAKAEIAWSLGSNKPEIPIEA
ncbi:hypothetical protein IPA_04770 [Ignicoccus pacificus DSM 13166]|uniref:Uncharacterized protein n=1 Tax=Ignicoccus pacificus DSM 13166 TaxID=940294 RepID=A0A977KC68_9CREN|nr:hypothetical protein IPA_04770 [Ignicoccus pacificus DSM 13166]